MTKSIISNEKRCFICGSERFLDRHHCIFGRAERSKAESDGLWVYLCSRHHMAVHQEAQGYKKMLQKLAQERWQQTYGTKEDFIKRYGRSYL